MKEKPTAPNVTVMSAHRDLSAVLWRCIELENVLQSLCNAGWISGVGGVIEHEKVE